MKKKQTWKRIAAWIMTAAMLTGNSSFAALAQEMDETPVQEAAAEAAVPEVQEAVPEPAAEDVAAEAAAEVPEEPVAEAPEESAAQTVEEAEAGAQAAPEDTAEPDAAVEEENTAGADIPAEPDTAAGEQEELPAESQEPEEDEEIIIGDTGEYTEDALLYEAPAAMEAGTAEDTGETVEPQYWFEAPLSGPKENEMLPGQEIWVGNIMHWTIKDGEELRDEYLPITNVEILAEYTWDENGGDVAAEAGSIVRLLGNAQDGWGLRGIDYGYARLRLTYTTPEGTEESLGNLGEQDYRVFVYGDVYHLEWDYPNGTGNILVGESIEISLSLAKEHYGEDGQHRYDTEENVQYKVMQYDENIADVSVEGETLTITGKSVGGMNIYVDALIPNDAGIYEPVSWTNIGAEVCESYVNIEPVRLDNVENGEILDLDQLGLQAVAYSRDNSRASAVLEDVRFSIREYDTDAWEPVTTREDGSVTALKRKGPWGTNVFVQAEQNQPAEDGADNWVEVGFRNYWFDDWYYDVWLDGLRENGWGWVYSNEENLTLTLNTDELAGKNFTVEWTVGIFDEEGNCTEPASGGTYTVSENQITLHGPALAQQYPAVEGEEEPCLGVRATVYMDGIEVSGTQNDVRIREPYYNYYGLPSTAPGDRDLIPGQNIWIDRRMSCFADDAEHPYGDHLEVPITNVEILSQGSWDENGNETGFGPDDAPALICEEEADGWRLCAQEMGWARVRITYQTVTGETVTYGEDPEDEFIVFVGGDVYRMEWIYPDGTEKMLFPGELLVNGSLRHEYIDGDGNMCSEQVENFRLTNLNYDEEALEASVTEDGRSILLTSKQPDRGEQIYAEVLVPDDTEESGYRIACGTVLNVEITGGYYVIRFENPPEDGGNLNPHAGEVLDLNELQPAIYACSTENPEGVRLESEDFRISLIRMENNETGWDQGAWEIVPGTESELIPSLKRIAAYGTGINLFIEERVRDGEGNLQTDENGAQLWQEAGRLWYEIPEQNYNVWFDDLRGGDQTWIFRNEEQELALNTSELEGIPYEVEWTTGYYDDETGDFIPTAEPGDGYTVNGERLVLHGDRLDGYIKPDTDGFNVRAVLKVNGIEVNQADTWMRVLDAQYDYDFPLSAPGENDMLPNENRGIGTEMNCYVEDADHPHGEDVPVAISDVTILGQGSDWNWDENAAQDYNILEEEAILELNGNASDGWNLWANGKGFGFAHIRITYTDVCSGEETFYDFPVFVGGERYEFGWQYSDNTDFMLTNSTMDVSTNLIRYYLAEDGSSMEENIEDYCLSVQWDDGTPTYDTELLNIEVVDNTRLHISSNDNQWSTDVFVRIMRRNEETQAYDIELFGDHIHVNVYEDYFKLEPAELTADGQTVNPLIYEKLYIAGFDPALWYYRAGEEPRQWDEVRYKLEYDENAWSISEDSQAVEEPVFAAELPELVRKATWGTNIDLLAFINVAGEGEAEEWQEVARYSYYFDDITDRYQADFIYSYGERMDEVIPGETVVSRVLTDIPLVLSLDTAGLHGVEKLEGCTVEWNFWQYNDETGTNEEAVCATWEIARDGYSVTLTGLEGHMGEWIDVQAVIRYYGNDVTYVWTHAMVDTCEHEWNQEDEKPSTCAKKGSRTFRCTKCGGARTEELPLAGHTWDAGAATTQPTCTDAGVKTYTCTVCGAKSYTEIVAALGHDYSPVFTIDVPATCAAEGSQSRHCTRCDAKTDVTAIPVIPHTWDAGAVTTQPTCTVAGVKTYTCTVCGDKSRTEAVPVIAHRGGTATCLAQAKCEVCGQAYGSKLKPVLKLTADSLKMRVKQSTTAFKVTEMAKGDYVVSVTSGNTKILKVSSLNKTKGTFKLTAQKKTGKAKLTVKLASGLSKTITVTVQKGTVTTTAISGLASSLRLDKGQTVTLKPVVTPVTSHQKVTYKSSNKKIVTVSSKGVIKAVKPGKATITVKSGKKSKKIKVVVNQVRTVKITEVPTTASVKKGKTLPLKTRLVPSNSTEGIKYTTSNKKVATVNSKGVIKGVSKGTAIITVKSGSRKVTCKVTVK